MKTYGRAFRDPDKGAMNGTLSLRQGVKLREIHKKAKGRMKDQTKVPSLVLGCEPAAVSSPVWLPLLPAAAHGQTRRKEVLAFYYGWCATQSRSDIVLHWPPQSPILDTPADGPYDSLDPAVIQRHAGQAKAAGLTGLVASWWGQGDRTDRQLPLLLDACHAQGLKVCAYVEQAGSADSVA